MKGVLLVLLGVVLTVAVASAIEVWIVVHEKGLA